MQSVAAQPSQSLARQTLLKMALRIAIIVIVTTFISYFHIMAALRAQTLEQLQKYVHERTERERTLFALAKDNHAVLKEAFLDRMAQADQNDSQARFERLFARCPDGVIRNRPGTFDGTRMPGVYIGKSQVVDADLRRRVVAYYDLCQSYGPAWHNRFQDTYFITPENITIIYWPEMSTWAQDAKADFDVKKEECFWAADPQHDPTRQPVWTGLYYDKVARLWMVALATPVEINGRHLATIGHDYLVNELMDRTVNSRLAGTYNILFRQDGRLIAHPQHMRDLETTEGQFAISNCRDDHLKRIFQTVTNRHTTTTILDNAHDDEYLAVSRIDGPNWYFVTVYPKSLLAAKAFEVARFVFLLGFAALLLELFILHSVLRRQVAAPLLTLITATERVAQGHLSVQLDTARRDELGSLARSFQAMAEAVEERDAQLEAQNVELERLVATRTADLVQANTRLEALATTDPLTGLPNHRALVAALEQELERSRRFNRPCALIFLDLDHFKALNDSCGHAAGDTTLCELGQVVEEHLRGMDTLGRWGGEEFVALLPETSQESAMQVAERIRQAVAEHRFQAGGGVYVTCSLGVATYPNDASDRSSLVAAADHAMYAAKRLGRNQVRAAADPAIHVVDAATENSREEVALLGIVEALAALVSARDQYTGSHTDDVAQLAMRIAMAMGVGTADARMVGIVGKLHDIGKVAIPDAILQKSGKLTAKEWEQMRRHPIIGADVIARIPSLRIIAPGIRGHHERWDGSGYPDGLAGEGIPLAARIVSVADAYGAITTNRPYRSASVPEWAIQELRRCVGSQFDPAVVAALERVLLAEASERQSPLRPGNDLAA